MVRKYLVDSPNNLWSLMFQAPETIFSSVGSLAKVWQALRRQGKSGLLDGNVYAVFDNGATPRRAELVRVDREGKEILVGTLFHYNNALKWCREHLESAA